jgi:hypothetical protein
MALWSIKKDQSKRGLYKRHMRWKGRIYIREISDREGLKLTVKLVFIRREGTNESLEREGISGITWIKRL